MQAEPSGGKKHRQGIIGNPRVVLNNIQINAIFVIYSCSLKSESIGLMHCTDFLSNILSQYNSNNEEGVLRIYKLWVFSKFDTG